MGSHSDHSGCPNPVDAGIGCSPVRTVYVREAKVDTGKLAWVPVGAICMGCGVFKAGSGSSFYTWGHQVPEIRAMMPAALQEPPQPDPHIAFPVHEYVLGKTYRFRHRINGWADITADWPIAALNYLGWAPDDVEIRKVWTSSGKPGTGGGVTAGWGKLEIPDPGLVDAFNAGPSADGIHDYGSTAYPIDTVSEPSPDPLLLPGDPFKAPGYAAAQAEDLASMRADLEEIPPGLTGNVRLTLRQIAAVLRLPLPIARARVQSGAIPARMSKSRHYWIDLGVLFRKAADLRRD